MPDDRFLYALGRWAWYAIPGPSYKRRKWQHIPTCGGVYAFYVDGVLAYIGSTRNLRNRIRQHDSNHHFPLGRSTVKAIGMSCAWKDRERRLVGRLAPPDNRQWTPAFNSGRERRGTWNFRSGGRGRPLDYGTGC